MRWLLNLFRKHDPPTEKQLRFASYLGIAVTSGMSKQEVSDAIDRKKAADPKAYGKACGQLGAANRRSTALAESCDTGQQQYVESDLTAADAAWLKSPQGKNLQKLLKKWQRITDNEPFGLFVYKHPDTGRVEVDVARIAQADTDHHPERGIRVVLDVSLPAECRDPQNGWKILEWSRDLGWFPADDVLLWHKLPESFADVEGCVLDRNASGEDRRQLKRYQTAIEKARKLARENRLL